MLDEFKKFAIRGNVIDLAVGIVIGAAFGAIVSGFVDQILMPIIGLITGGTDFSNMFILLRDGDPAGPYATVVDARAAGAVVVAYGLFVNALVNFVIVALALFLLVRVINSLRAAEVPPPPPGPTKEEVLLSEIRDLLAHR